MQKKIQEAKKWHKDEEKVMEEFLKAALLFDLEDGDDDGYGFGDGYGYDEIDSYEAFAWAVHAHEHEHHGGFDPYFDLD